MRIPSHDLITKHYQEEMIKALTSPLWITKYMPPDTRPAWHKFLSRTRNRIYWMTLGRFREWLHRDCGDC
jgi:hypothetical protein